MAFTPVNHIDGTEGCNIINDYELEEVAMLLLIPLEDLRCALLYRSLTVVLNNTVGCTPSQSVDPMVNCFSRDSTLCRGESRSAILNHHGGGVNQRPSVVSNSTSIVGREVFQIMSDETGKNDVVADLSAAEATAARDALCKVLYARLFTWLVNSINERIKVRQIID